MPYYGRAWSTSTSKLNAKNISGTKNGTSVTVTYDTAREFAVTYGKDYDPVEGVAWTAYRRQNCTATYGCVTPWRELYFDDATALKAKYDLVNQYSLRGAGIWALGYDGTRPELYEAIKAKFITDTVPPAIKSGSISSGLISPNGDGRSDTTTAKLSATGLTVWGYAVQPVSGATVGAAIRSGSQAGRSPSLTWDGKNQGGALVNDGTYRLTLWTADASDNRAERRFTVTVDRTAAAVTSAASRGYFSPDGDGHIDTLPLSWKGNEALTGVVRIRNSAGTSVRAWSFTKKTSWKTSWTGRTAAGAVVPAGRYIFRVDGRDRAGNRTDRRADDPRRWDDQGRALDRPLVRPASQADQPGRHHVPSLGDDRCRHLPGEHARPEGLDEPRRQDRHVPLDVDRQDGRRGVRQARHVQGHGDRHQQVRDHPLLEERDGPGPLTLTRLYTCRP